MVDGFSACKVRVGVCSMRSCLQPAIGRDRALIFLERVFELRVGELIPMAEVSKLERCGLRTLAQAIATQKASEESSEMESLKQVSGEPGSGRVA